MMIRKWVLCAASIYIVAALNVASAAPSFDCTKASTRVEKIICGSDVLSRLDDEMAQRLGARLVASTNPQHIRAEQSSWLNSRRNKCASETCLVEAYNQRLRALGGSRAPSSVASAPEPQTTQNNRVLVGKWSGTGSDKSPIFRINSRPWTFRWTSSESITVEIYDASTGVVVSSFGSPSQKGEMELSPIGNLRFTISTIGGWTAAITVPSSSGSDDPYAASGAKQEMTSYLEKRADYLDVTRRLYFSVGCKVFASEAGILPLLSIQRRTMLGGTRIVDTNVDALEQDAARSGLAQAARPGGCDYWHNNPDQVQRLRRAAEAAR